MPFGVVSGVGLVMGVLDFGGDVEGEGAVWGEFAASHCNQWGINLLRRCVEMRTAIELSFGVVSGMDPGIHVLDGSPRASREGVISGMVSGSFQNFSCINLNGDMAH